MFIHKNINDEPWCSDTLKVWLEEAKIQGDEGIFIASEVEERFSRLKRRTADLAECHAYLLYDDESDSAATAVLEFTHAMGHTNSSWLKLLNIHLRPSLLPDSALMPNDEKTDKISLAYGKSIASAVSLIFDGHPSKELKIYARTHEMRSYFKFITDYKPLSDKLSAIGLVMIMEGAWLIVRKTD